MLGSQRMAGCDRALRVLNAHAVSSIQEVQEDIRGHFRQGRAPLISQPTVHAGKHTKKPCKVYDH